jgi:hypothetical protein
MIALDRLQQIIPSDQALANKALATSLAQIGGIDKLTVEQFGALVSAQQTTRNLPAVTALEQPVPASVAANFAATLAQGTGPNGTIVAMDLLGTAAGWISTDAFAEATQLISTMTLTTLAGIYTTMLEVVQGVYGDPITGPVVIPSGPFAGTYTDANEVFSTQLTPAANTEISNLVTAYPDQTLQLNSLWTSISAQIAREKTLQASANLVFADLQANQRNSIYGLVYGLPEYGLNTQVGGTAQLVQGVADITSFTGQCVIGAMREGQNQQALNAAGIVVSNQIPSEPAEPPPQATLIPATYTEAEAENLVIK